MKKIVKDAIDALCANAEAAEHLIDKNERKRQIMLVAYSITVILMTFVTLLVYNYDFAVVKGQWRKYYRIRIPEYVLLTLTAFGGSLGAYASMKVQKHKANRERKPHFHFVIYFSLIINLITFVALLVLELI